jgi:RepB DNA-primase from phage plasmid
MVSEQSKAKEMSAAEYLRASFHPSDRLAILVRNPKRRHTIQRISSAAKIIEPTFQDWLRFKNYQEFSDIYVGMNPLNPQAHTRTKEDIRTIRHLYADFDNDGDASLAAIEQSKLVPSPNFILNTSPGKFQVVWKVEDVTCEQAEPMLRAIARRFGGDPASTDSTRVLRLPGFANRKYDAEFIVKAVQHSDRTYHLFDFNLPSESLDSLRQALRRSPPRESSSGTRTLSQSEHDWAYAKRNLARGVDSEQVIRNIADFRSQDKHDPQDYARRTVVKAQAELNARKGQSAHPPGDSAEAEHDL